MNKTLKTSSPETPSLPSPKLEMPPGTTLVIHVKYLPKSRNVERRMHWRAWQKEKRKAWYALLSALSSTEYDWSTLTPSTRKILSMASLKLGSYLAIKSVR